MLEATDVWKFLAGLGIFIYAMRTVEDALKNFSGRQFKLFLRRNTQNKFKAILSGTLVTAILQSSSVVSLMVLAFVGAGVLSMQNALAVVFGANLGTTVTGWLVATLGFKFEIESFSYPFIALAVLALIFLRQDKKLHHFAKFILGAGFLFLGLGYMKSGMEALVNNADISIIKSTNKFILMFAGLVFTALIQSSSATMAIILSAIYSGAIGFPAGAAILLGAETGTTLKILIGGMDGVPDKKRVALGNFLFNLLLMFGGIIFLDALIWLVNRLIGVEDPLISLVLFQSILNFIGIVLFLPFLNIFSKWLNSLFRNSKKFVAVYIFKVPADDIPMALQALKNEAFHIINRTIALNLQAFSIKFFKTGIVKSNGNSYESNYSTIKQLEGEIISFYMQMQKHPVKAQESEKAMQFISSVRGAMHSAKEIKNIHHNLKDIEQSAEDFEHNCYLEIQKYSSAFYNDIVETLALEEQEQLLEKIKLLLQNVENEYNAKLHNIYGMVKKSGTTEEELSTFMNINREIYSSGKAIVRAVKDLKLSKENAEIINNLPPYHADKARL